MNKVIKLAAVIAILVFAATAMLIRTFTGKEAVVVVNQNIKAGTNLTENMLTQREIPSTSRVKGSSTDLNDFVGKEITVDRFKNDQVSQGMLRDKRSKLKDGEGVITFSISKEEADNIRLGDMLTVITYLNNSEARQIPGFKVNRMTPRITPGSGLEECILTVSNEVKANESLAPFIKNGNYKIEVVGG